MRSDIRPVTRWNRAERAWETRSRGYSVLSDSRLNKGTAFTDPERTALGLNGLLPSRVLTLDQQAERAYRQCSQAAQRPGQEHLPDRAARPQRGALLPGTDRPPQRATAHCLHAHDRRGHPALQPPVPPPARRLSQHRRARPDRDRACALPDCPPTRWTSSSPPTPRRSSASATGASAASTSRSASSPSIPPRPASTRPGPCR